MDGKEYWSTRVYSTLECSLLNGLDLTWTECDRIIRYICKLNRLNRIRKRIRNVSAWTFKRQPTTCQQMETRERLRTRAGPRRELGSGIRERLRDVPECGTDVRRRHIWTSNRTKRCWVEGVHIIVLGKIPGSVGYEGVSVKRQTWLSSNSVDRDRHVLCIWQVGLACSLGR